jgi:hypothetical protein
VPAPVLIRKFVGHDSDILVLTLSPDGKRALSTHQDGQTVLWNVSTGKMLNRINDNPASAAEAVAFGPDGTWALSGGKDDKKVRIWDTTSGAQKATIGGMTTPISRLTVFRDGKRALAGTNSMRLLDLENCLVKKIYDPKTLTFDAIAVALSPNEKLAVSGGMMAVIYLWDVESGVLVRTFKHHHTQQIRSLQFSPDGTRVLSACMDGTARIWNVADGSQLVEFDKHAAAVSEAVFMPDGRHVASISWDKTVRIWDSATGQEVYKISLPAKGAGLAVLPGRQQILAACSSVSDAGPSGFNLGLWQIPVLPSGKTAAPPSAVGPFTDADVKRIAGLPAEQQVEEVRKELMRRNPGFDGKMESRIEGGVVTELGIVTDRVTDIAPIRVFNSLRWLGCTGTHTNKPNGLLADLTPLEGMHLAGLRRLDLFGTMVTDAGMAYIKDCKELASLNLSLTRVSDAGLAHLKDCKNLTKLFLNETQVTEAGLAHCKDMPLSTLWIQETGITDLTPLQGMPLNDIRLTPRNINRGLDVLRGMKSVKTIGIFPLQAWPAAEFWERYDKGEFKE